MQHWLAVNPPLNILAMLLHNFRMSSRCSEIFEQHFFARARLPICGKKESKRKLINEAARRLVSGSDDDCCYTQLPPAAAKKTAYGARRRAHFARRAPTRHSDLQMKKTLLFSAAPRGSPDRAAVARTTEQI